MPATKDDICKARTELIPPEALISIAQVFTFGANKYEAHNWRKGFKWTRLVGAMLRHTYAWLGGESNDPESGYSHLAHIGCNIMMLIVHEKLKLGEDDRYAS